MKTAADRHVPLWSPFCCTLGFTTPKKRSILQVGCWGYELPTVAACWTNMKKHVTRVPEVEQAANFFHVLRPLSRTSSKKSSSSYVTRRYVNSNFSRCWTPDHRNYESLLSGRSEARLEEPCLLVEWCSLSRLPPKGGFEPWLLVTPSVPKGSR